MTNETIHRHGPEMPRKGTGDPLLHAILYEGEHRGTDPNRSDGVASPFDLTTHQGIFDHVASAVIRQGTRAPQSKVLDHREILTGDGQVCAYRAGSLRSPIGFLITDAAYGEDLELLHLYSRSDDGSHPVIEALDPGIPRDRDTMTLISTLQNIHDGPRARVHLRNWWHGWLRNMERLAEGMALDHSVLRRERHSTLE